MHAQSTFNLHSLQKVTDATGSAYFLYSYSKRLTSGPESKHLDENISKFISLISVSMSFGCFINSNGQVTARYIDIRCEFVHDAFMNRRFNSNAW